MRAFDPLPGAFAGFGGEALKIHRAMPHSPPSLIWPTDRAWFIGIPIYTAEIAIGAERR